MQQFQIERVLPKFAHQRKQQKRLLYARCQIKIETIIEQRPARHPVKSS